MLTHGDNGKYSFVLHRKADIYNRRAAKIASCLLSTFTAFYATQWTTWFGNQSSMPIPIFHANTYVIPSDDMLKGYLRDRQAKIKSLGTTFLRKPVQLPNDKPRIHIIPFGANLQTELFWTEHPYLLINDKPDLFELDLSILHPLLEKYPNLSYGNDLEFHKFWRCYQSEALRSDAVQSTTAIAGDTYDWLANEVDDVVPPNEWIVVRIDGKGFHKFSAKNNFEKPNDEQGKAANV